MRDNARAPRPKVHKPFPDALAEGYGVVAGPGGINFAGKEMHVPLGESPYARMVRLHEMGHLRFTPPQTPDIMCRKYGVTMDALQCCEDARINTLLETRLGLPMSELGEAEDLSPFRHGLEKALTTGNRMEAIKQGAEVRVAFQSRNPYGIAEILYDLGLGEAVTLAERALKELHSKGKGIPFTRTIKAAKILAEGLADMRALHESPGRLDPEEVEGSSPRPGSVPWGDMTVEQPPRSGRFGAKLSPRNRMSDTGIRLRHVSRLLTDGRCFSHRVRQSGGSLLIDGSGSMHMSPEDVQQILKIAPLAWVAIYGAGMERGTVKVLARDGKAVAPTEMFSPGLCNVIDGPALALLATQSAPRIWICDGRVTGVGDKSGWGNTVECAKICTAANIRRIDTVREAVPYLASLSKVR